jgi:hypothetical protein
MKNRMSYPGSLVQALGTFLATTECGTPAPHGSVYRFRKLPYMLAIYITAMVVSPSPLPWEYHEDAIQRFSRHALARSQCDKSFGAVKENPATVAGFSTASGYGHSKRTALVRQLLRCSISLCGIQSWRLLSEDGTGGRLRNVGP